jgi:hypothetical protein
MYDVLAELFVIGVAGAYFVLSLILAVLWFRSLNRPRRGVSHAKASGSDSHKPVS